jgi:hypothetical protein
MVEMRRLEKASEEHHDGDEGQAEECVAEVGG